jgi:hypothetical protein
LHPFEAEAGKIQLFHENIDHTYRVVGRYIVVQELGKQRTLSSILASNKALQSHPYR